MRELPTGMGCLNESITSGPPTAQITIVNSVYILVGCYFVVLVACCMESVRSLFMRIYMSIGLDSLSFLRCNIIPPDTAQYYLTPFKAKFGRIPSAVNFMLYHIMMLYMNVSLSVGQNMTTYGWIVRCKCGTRHDGVCVVHISTRVCCPPEHMCILVTIVVFIFYMLMQWMMGGIRDRSMRRTLGSTACDLSERYQSPMQCEPPLEVGHNNDVNTTHRRRHIKGSSAVTCRILQMGSILYAMVRGGMVCVALRYTMNILHGKQRQYSFDRSRAHLGHCHRGFSTEKYTHIIPPPGIASDRVQGCLVYVVGYYLITHIPCLVV